jgi:hypothetical protein
VRGDLAARTTQLVVVMVRFLNGMPRIGLHRILLLVARLDSSHDWGSVSPHS